MKYFALHFFYKYHQNLQMDAKTSCIGSWAHINIRVRLANQCSRLECRATRSLYLDTRVLIKYATTYRVYEVTAQRKVENRYSRQPIILTIVRAESVVQLSSVSVVKIELYQIRIDSEFPLSILITIDLIERATDKLTHRNIIQLCNSTNIYVFLMHSLYEIVMK